jgi:hypothetical protein
MIIRVKAKTPDEFAEEYLHKYEIKIKKYIIFFWIFNNLILILLIALLSISIYRNFNIINNFYENRLNLKYPKFWEKYWDSRKNY